MTVEVGGVPANQLEPPQLNVYYASVEILIAVVAIVGNALVLVVFHREPRLHRWTNYFIVSLSWADILIGLFGLPLALASSVGWPPQREACHTSLSFLLALCIISILSLLAVSVDRYCAIAHPFAYSGYVKNRKPTPLIAVCWVAGSLLGMLPLFGWSKWNREHPTCRWEEAIDFNFLAFMNFVCIVLPTIIMFVCYLRIYIIVRNHVSNLDQARDQITDDSKETGPRVRNNLSETRLARKLAIIVLVFVVCWTPLFTFNTIAAFCRSCVAEFPVWSMYSLIVLSHLNCALNPLLYAYHMRDFRHALKRLVFCQQTRPCEANIECDNEQPRLELQDSSAFSAPSTSKRTIN